MGQVYVITDGLALEDPYTGMLTSAEFIKIGFTSNEVEQRISQLQTGNPKKLHLVYQYFFETCEMAKQAEKMCHCRLSKHRVNGEWFRYNKDVFRVLEALERLSEFNSFTAPDEPRISDKNIMELING